MSGWKTKLFLSMASQEHLESRRRTNESKYRVIQFLELPYKDIEDYVCIPCSWIRLRRHTDRKVVVSYPVENPSDTEKRVKKRQKFSVDWFLYMAVVKYNTDLYEDAKIFIKTKSNDVYYESNSSNKQNGDHGLSTMKNIRKSKRTARSNSKKDITLESVATSKNKEQPAIKIKLKRVALSKPDEEVDKQPKVIKPAKSVSEFTEQSYQAFEYSNRNQSSTTHKEFTIQNVNTQEMPVEKCNNGNCVEKTTHLNTSTQNGPSVIKNIEYLTASSSDPQTIAMQKKCFADFFIVFKELYVDLSKTTKLMGKILNSIENSSAPTNNIPTISSSNDTTAEVTKVSEKNKNRQIDDDDDEDDDNIGDDDNEEDDTANADKVLKKRLCHKRKFVLPPEYDENDSRWTLKYRKPAPGLVELMPHTGVYINAVKLGNCKRLSKDCKKLARMLSEEIFSKSALSTCSLTGARAKAFDVDGTDIRPGLDEHARTVLLTFVEEYGSEKRLLTSDTQSILNSIRNKMQEMRFKYG